jgi:serine/threonine protein kinase
MTIACPSCAAPAKDSDESCPGCGRSLGSLAIGALLASRYDLRAILDDGGTGVVYRAFDRGREVDVAVKAFRTDLPSNAAAVRRFRAEIGRAAAVSHSNLGRIADHGEDGRFGFIVMDMLAGEDLRRGLRAHSRGLPEGEALSAVLQMAAGVGAIHAAGLTHGDLKTAQGIRDSEGVVRVVPFGLGKDPLSASGPAGEFLGAPEYMSPEQSFGYDTDSRSDVYALGIVAFELLTGEVPLRGKGAMETLFKQMREAPSFETEAGARVPRRLVPALTRALAKSAAERFATAKEFADALGAEGAAIGIVVPSTPVAAAPLAPPTPALATPPPPDHGPADARKDERITMPTDVRFRKLGKDGAPVKEERTVADDLSRSGMRVLTSWSDLVAGDQVSIEEVGGTFTTGAIVRHVSRGSDQITRVGIQFLDNRAPDRLVGTSARPRNTGTTPRPRNTGSNARPRNTGATARARNSGGTRRTTSIPRPGPTSSVVRPADATPPPPPPPPRSPESVRKELATVLAPVKDLVAESKIWEALDCLARAQAIADGTPEAHPVRVLTWETQAKVPSLMRAAQENLEEIARNDPRDLIVHSALGRMFWGAGLAARARVAFKHVLALDPSNREAIEALEALNDPNRRKP